MVVWIELVKDFGNVIIFLIKPLGDPFISHGRKGLNLKIAIKDMQICF